MGKEIKLNDSGFEMGIYTFGELLSDPHTGQFISAKQRINEIIEAAKLADAARLDVFGIGEHHRLDFAVSSPPVLLAAIAQVTSQIKLISATTILSTADPVRLFEDFATLDIISNGRAELVAGRGAFLESYSLFGYSLDDYDHLFGEKIELLLKLNENERITWKGQFRSELRGAEIAPRPIQQGIPVWIGVGGSQESAERAGRLGQGLMLAVLGGDPSYFKPIVEAYRCEGLKAGHIPAKLKVAVGAHGYLSKISQKAKKEFYPYYKNYFKSFMKNGMLTNISEADFEQMVSPNNSLFVGSPQEMIEKILRQYELFGHQRFLAQIDIGGVPFKNVAKSIELLATEVAPVVRKEIEKSCKKE
ncbi:LLM class flavin-dependent oxidoreductase [Neobacillus cucumis]|uniref:LLM class flavin-dependent oxidoreductase n=1 Tax=Neobacillus cucumis TaxID=1740721 RepID=UPI0018DF5D0B|nr:LLM class flavin-dependent oxidoreductase [Neobacillus cucumis]MBI0577917.1 LLM class flavin-dependent oxidoreductase [Neobacillus cucumis]